MFRNFALCSLTLAGLLGLNAEASAQVYVRAPFVRVSVGGGGVNVQAPFVNVGVSNPPPIMVAQMPPVQVVPEKGPEILPVPQPMLNVPMPQPMLKEVRPMTLAEFAGCVQFRCGTYEAVLLNPCTCQPCLVRFCLPDCPRRVTCNRNEIVFHYGLLKKVRVQFDRGGAHVVSTVR